MPDGGQCSTVDPASTMYWAELGNGAASNRNGEGLTCFSPTEHLADVVAQFFLCDMAHAGMVA